MPRHNTTTDTKQKIPTTDAQRKKDGFNPYGLPVLPKICKSNTLNK